MPGLLVSIELAGIVAILAGWGFLSGRLLQRMTSLELDGYGWFELSVLGTVAAYLYASTAALVFPLAGPVTVIFTVIGAAGFLGALWVRRQASSVWVWGFSVGIWALVAIGTVHTPLNYDAG